MHPSAIRIGRCKLLLQDRVLLADGKPAKIGSRALDILLCLARKRGQTVSARELMKSVWPDSIVEENTLRVQIRNLRRTLSSYGGGVCIVNRSGRGYALVVPDDNRGGRTGNPIVERRRMAATLTGLIGRDDALRDITERLLDHRLVTLTGAGGIGKTAVALEIGKRWQHADREDVYHIDFAGLRDERLVASTAARALGLSVSDRSPTEAIVGALSEARALVILDTCEHVVDGVANLVELLLKSTSALRILVTSREVLRIRGEWVTRLQPLPFPADEIMEDIITDASYPAIDLFMERSAASGCVLPFEPGSVAAIGKICARLDGLPLAIELAAARVEEFGLSGLLTRLDQHLSILTDGLRTGAPRQRTMRAALDWSYVLLSPTEQRLLMTLSVLQSPFTPETAVAVASGESLSEQDVLDGLNLLYRKSLLSVASIGGLQHFRLLDTTRAYAAERLHGSGYERLVRGQHAAYVRSILARGRGADSALPPSLSDFELQEVRAALDWASSDEGDAETLLDLTIAALPAWFERSLVDECRRRVQQALSGLNLSEQTDPRALDFYAALGGAYMNIEGAGAHTRSAWMKVYKLAGRQRSLSHRLQAIWGLWVDTRNRGMCHEAVKLSRRFERLARVSDDPSVQMNAWRMQGISNFFLGDLVKSRRYIERALASDDVRSDLVTFQFDQRITSRCFLAQILWLQGFPDQAFVLAVQNVEDAIALDHPGTISYALTEGGCPVAWNVGDLAALERFSKLVLQRTARKGMEVWRTIGEFFDGILRLKRGDEAGLQILKEAISLLRTTFRGPVFTRGLAVYALEVARRGRAAEAIGAMEEALQRARECSEAWCAPELLRIKGLIHRELGLAGSEMLLLEAMRLGSRQGALAWELRAATSLCEHYLDEGEHQRAFETLHPVYERFGEGFATEDMRRADAVLRRLGASAHIRSYAASVT
ncbi:hypothetical protein C7U60_14725 [Mesorhizobium plurifarium]|uniref:winged helix-turn-helix domain-containing protein n=1 Tax=Sinorhizobium arboris TaxID=76745 RepID=UPI00040F4BAF|nr:winged helix-turn-helix domain-containing protein [Sinorhizobium arboris]PST22457.1 hypothetical protein C7U60_14725 [Mesorhizobium plurifarium]